MRGRFVVVEGLDFAGKTTVGMLAVQELERLGLPAVHNTAKDRRLRAWSKRIAGRRGVPVLVPDLLFLLAVLHDTALIARRLRRGVSVVQDRYYPSYVWNQLAIPRSRRGGPSMLAVYRLLRPLFLEPDLVIYCRCTAATLRARYEVKRRASPEGLSPNDLVVFSDEAPERLTAYEAAFGEALDGMRPVVRIDNDGSLEELEQSVIRALQPPQSVGIC